MANSLTYSATTLAIPDDLQWVDEYAWREVEQRREYSITGALLIEAAVKQSGRPITLQGGPGYAWITRSTLDTLRTWAALPGQAFTLVLRGATGISVAFDHERGAIDAAPIVDYSDPDNTDDYSVTLRFIEL